MRPEFLGNYSDRSTLACPDLLILTRQLGASGQPWMWRQVTGLQGFAKRVAYWRRENPDSQPQTDFEEVQLFGDPAPYDGPGRWLLRCRNALRGNYYASVGRERRQISELMARKRPDVVLCYFGDVAMRILPTALEKQVPVVAYLHGDFLFNTHRWYRSSLLRSLPHFAAVVVVTTAERDWLHGVGVPSHKIHVVPCGAPINVFRPATHTSRADVRFIMASRLSEEKGCHLSLMAFSKFVKSHPSVRLSVFGDGPQRPDLEKMAADLGLTSQIDFHGYVNQTDLAAQMTNHDIFIQHSLRKEGSPVSIVEAMASGLPVISTPVGGIADLVLDRETGLVVKEGDVNSMAEAMELLIDAKVRRTMGRAAVARARTYFNSDVQTEILGRVLVAAQRGVDYSA
jgi:glycosyltransferase involved in cell wall biosynthesis